MRAKTIFAKSYLIILIAIALIACKPNNSSAQVNAENPLLTPALYMAPKDQIAGNPMGDITIVEFFDYRCGACKRGFAEVQKLLKTDGHLRVIARELPILGQTSNKIAHTALAATGQNKYLAFHDALMSTSSPVSWDDTLQIAQQMGLNLAQLTKDMNDGKIQQQIVNNKSWAHALGINATPSYLIAKTTWKNGKLQVKRAELVIGALSVAGFKQKIDAISYPSNS